MTHRLERTCAERQMAFATPTPEMIAEAMVEELPKPAQAKPVEADGAARAAKMLAELLQEAARA